VQTHFATIGLVRIAPNGTLYNASDTKKSFKEALMFETDHRILPDASIPNSAGYPNIQQYLNLEATSGFQPVQVAQYFVVTVKLT
jgi:hypothetical protein